MDSTQVIGWVSTIFQAYSAQIALLSLFVAAFSLYFNYRQVKAGEASAKAAETSAKTAEKALLESIKPVLNLLITKNSNQKIKKDVEHYYYFDIVLQNLGKRACKNVIVKFSPEIYTEQYIGEVEGELEFLPIEDRIVQVLTEKKVSYLNANSQILLTDYGRFFIIGSVDELSTYTITINYEDFMGKKEEPIEIKAFLPDLDQQLLL